MTEGHQETEGDQEIVWVERPGRQRASAKARGELQGRPVLQGAESEGVTPDGDGERGHRSLGAPGQIWNFIPSVVGSQKWFTQNTDMI